MHHLVRLSLGFALVGTAAMAAGARTAGGSARAPLVLYESWAAFREERPLRCYAIAEPARLPRRATPAKPFVAVSVWPKLGLRDQLHVRLSRLKRRGAPTWLAIGGQRVLLASGGRDAWAVDARADAAIVALMRGGSSMSVETVDAIGRPFADTYRLRGAATAIDAAALGCAG